MDLAPTFCAIAGCRMRHPDGRSLLPLMHGTADRLGRDYDLEKDPDQLENLAGRPQFEKVERRLRRLLHERVITPDRVRFLRHFD